MSLVQLDCSGRESSKTSGGWPAALISDKSSDGRKNEDVWRLVNRSFSKNIRRNTRRNDGINTTEIQTEIQRDMQREIMKELLEEIPKEVLFLPVFLRVCLPLFIVVFALYFFLEYFSTDEDIWRLVCKSIVERRARRRNAVMTAATRGYRDVRTACRCCCCCCCCC